MVVAKYLRERDSYEMQPFNPTSLSYFEETETWVRGANNYAGKFPAVHRSEIVRPVFWLDQDPVSLAKAAVAAHEAEETRRKNVAQAEEQSKLSNLAIPQGHLVTILPDKTQSYVQEYKPDSGEYMVRVEGRNGQSRFVPIVNVQPCFLLEDDPLAAAADRDKVHAREETRLETVAAANLSAEAMTAKHGGLLALPSGQLVKAIGEAALRRPSDEHDGLARVAAFDPATRVYDIVFRQSKAATSLTNTDSPTRTCVKAARVTPVFWEFSDPAEGLHEVAEQHNKERERLEAVKTAHQQCQHVHLDLPKNTIVEEVSNSTQPVTTPELRQVHAYCRLTQTYSLAENVKNRSRSISGVNHRSVPATSVIPRFWSAEEPAKQVPVLLAAHTAEEQRLAAAQAADRQLRPGLLGLPVGMPVRLMQKVQPKVAANTLPPSASWRTRVMGAFAQLMPQTQAGCNQGDLAYVSHYHPDGSYMVALNTRQLGVELVGQDDEGYDCGLITTASLAGIGLGSTAVVEAEALRPVLLGAGAPAAALERILARHEEEQARINESKSALSALPQGLLGLQPGTDVAVKGHGIGSIARYFPSSGTYAVRIRSARTQIVSDVPPDWLALALGSNCEDAARWHEEEVWSV